MKKMSVIFFILFLLQLTVEANDVTIVEVRRNIPLSDEDPVYQDFTLNAGASSGLKKNLVVNVKRKLNVRDASTKVIGEIETVVGQLRVIHVDQKVSVAREYKLIPREEEAMLEQIGMMAGDVIDMKGSFMDSKPIKRKEREPSSQAAVTLEVPVTPPPVPTEKPVSPDSSPIKPVPFPTPEI